MREKTSAIWKISDKDLLDIVTNSINLTECLSKLGLPGKGSSFVSFKKRAKLSNIDLSGFSKTKAKRIKPLELHLIANSSYARSNLKKRIIKDLLLKHECNLCGMKNIWNGKPLSLQLDHINGIPNDNRIENLRFLCPNCHSQTDTFAGRGRKRRVIKVNKIRKKRVYKTRCPDYQTLLELVDSIPTIHIAKKYGVTDKAVEKWCKKFNIAKPGRGSWTKK